jgi:hypothetical protein
MPILIATEASLWDQALREHATWDDIHVACKELLPFHSHKHGSCLKHITGRMVFHIACHFIFESMYMRYLALASEPPNNNWVVLRRK